MCVHEGHGSMVLGSSLSLSFHPRSTPQAVACEAGGGWHVVIRHPIPAAPRCCYCHLLLSLSFHPQSTP